MMERNNLRKKVLNVICGKYKQGVVRKMSYIRAGLVIDVCVWDKQRLLFFLHLQ